MDPTKISTSENYIIESSDITLDNSKKRIFQKKTTVTDQDNNQIFVDNFDFETENSIFKSIGNIEIFDNKDNKYQFSQVYIDTTKKEILVLILSLI